MSRSPKIKRQAPPLVTWLLAASLAAVWGAVSISVLSSDTKEQERQEIHEMYNLDRFDEFLDEDKERPAPLVTALGSSFSEAAFAFDKYFERAVRNEDKRELRFIRLVQMGHNPEPFYGVFDTLLAARPNLVVIEAGMLLYAEHGKASPVLDRHRAHWREALFGSPMGIPIEDGAALSDLKARRPEFEKNKEINRAEHRMFFWPRLPTQQSPQDFENYKKAHHAWPGCIHKVPAPMATFFEQARKRGIRILMLHLAGPPEARAIELPAQTECLRELETQYKERLDVYYDVFPSKYGLKYYRDFIHFNIRGREAFRAWFIEEFRWHIWQKG